MVQLRFTSGPEDPRLPLARMVSAFMDVIQEGDHHDSNWTVHPRSTTCCDCLVEACDVQVFRINAYHSTGQFAEKTKELIPDIPEHVATAMLSVESGNKWIFAFNEEINSLMRRWPLTKCFDGTGIPVWFDGDTGMRQCAVQFGIIYRHYIEFAQSSYMKYKEATSFFRGLGISPVNEILHPPSRAGVTWMLDDCEAISAYWIGMSEITYIQELIGQRFIKARFEGGRDRCKED